MLPYSEYSTYYNCKCTIKTVQIIPRFGIYKDVSEAEMCYNLCFDLFGNTAYHAVHIIMHIINANKYVNIIL